MDQCHYCKTTDEDLATLFDEKFGPRMDELSGEMEKDRDIFKKAHDAVIESGVDLDFTMGTIMSDQEAFSKTIPQFDDILVAFNLLIKGENGSFNMNSRISDVVGMMKNLKPSAARGVGEEYQEYTAMRDEFILQVKTVPFGQIRSNAPIHFTIQVCPICNKVLERTASAAYEVLHADDGDWE